MNSCYYCYFCIAFCVTFLRDCNAQEPQPSLPCENGEAVDARQTPLLPSVFRAELELVNFADLDSNPVYVTLNYDRRHEGRVAVSYTLSENTRRIVLDYEQRRVIQYTEANDECSVSSLENDDYWQEMRVLFPLFDLDVEKGKMFESEALFGIKPTVFGGYFGTDSCRGEDRFAQPGAGAIDCEKWAFCHNTTDGVNNAFVYWSVINWNVPGSARPVFLGYEVQRRKEGNDTAVERKSVNVMYISDDLDQSAFEIPEGVVCDVKSGVSQLPFPKVQTAGVWEFQTEAVFNERRKIMTTHTWFDFSDGLGRISYTKNDEVLVTSIADWNRDLVYVQSGGKCEVRKLLTGVFAEIGAQELPIIQFGSPAAMFGGDDISNWKYVGKKYVRNEMTDVWQRVRKDWPNSQYSTNSLWDWHFTSAPDGRPIPSYLRIRVLSVANEVSAYGMNSVIEYHIYGFRFHRNSDQFDVTECFSSAEKQHLQFQLKVENDSRLIAKPKVDFLWRLKIAIAAVAEVSFLRIAQIRTVIEGKKLFVQFYLLDKPTGEDLHEPTLDAAKENLNKIIQNGLFNIPFNEETDLSGVANTLTDVRKVCTAGKPRNKRATTRNGDAIKRSPEHTSDDALGVCVGSLLSGLAVGASTTLLVAIKKSLA